MSTYTDPVVIGWMATQLVEVMGGDADVEQIANVADGLLRGMSHACVDVVLGGMPSTEAGRQVIGQVADELLDIGRELSTMGREPALANSEVYAGGVYALAELLRPHGNGQSWSRQSSPSPAWAPSRVVAPDGPLTCSPGEPEQRMRCVRAFLDRVNPVGLAREKAEARAVAKAEVGPRSLGALQVCVDTAAAGLERLSTPTGAPRPRQPRTARATTGVSRC